MPCAIGNAPGRCSRSTACSSSPGAPSRPTSWSCSARRVPTCEGQAPASARSSARRQQPLPLERLQLSWWEVGQHHHQSGDRHREHPTTHHAGATAPASRAANLPSNAKLAASGGCRSARGSGLCSSDPRGGPPLSELGPPRRRARSTLMYKTRLWSTLVSVTSGTPLSLAKPSHHSRSFWLLLWVAAVTLSSSSRLLPMDISPTTTTTRRSAQAPAPTRRRPIVFRCSALVARVAAHAHGCAPRPNHWARRFECCRRRFESDGRSASMNGALATPSGRLTAERLQTARFAQAVSSP